MTLAVVAARRLEVRIVSRRRLRRPPRPLIDGIFRTAGATGPLSLGTITDHRLRPCASLVRDAGMAFTRAGLHNVRGVSRRRLSLRGSLLSHDTGVAAATTGGLGPWAIPSLGLRNDFFPRDDAVVVTAVAGLRARRIMARRSLSLRGSLLSNGTGVAAATAARLDRWAIRRFGLSRRGDFPSVATGVAIATAGRCGLRVVPARPLGR